MSAQSNKKSTETISKEIEIKNDHINTTTPFLISSSEPVTKAIEIATSTISTPTKSLKSNDYGRGLRSAEDLAYIQSLLPKGTCLCPCASSYSEAPITEPIYESTTLPAPPVLPIYEEPKPSPSEYPPIPSASQVKYEENPAQPAYQSVVPISPPIPESSPIPIPNYQPSPPSAYPKPVYPIAPSYQRPAPVVPAYPRPTAPAYSNPQYQVRPTLYAPPPNPAYLPYSQPAVSAPSYPSYSLPEAYHRSSPAQCPQNILISCHPNAQKVPCLSSSY